jgi:hypothetical protein
MLKHLSRFVLQWLPTIGAIVIGGFLIGGYYINAAWHPTGGAKLLFEQSITADFREPVVTPPRVVRDTPRPEPTAAPEPAPALPPAAASEPAAAPAPAEVKATVAAAKAPDQPPRKVAAKPHSPHIAATKREPAPLAIAPPPAPSPTPAAPVVASVNRPPADLTPPPKPPEPVRVLGLVVPPAVVAVGEKLDPTPLWRTGEKVIDHVVATAKSAVSDFSR